ncbi:MAG TPA: VOC family protein [Nitrososphaerales archaeon]|nr:VOC family protein [Nitrososphaerales archaeon]
MVKPPRVWIGSVVIDCKKFNEMIAFWSAALGYKLRPTSSDDWALIYDPRGSGPNLAFQKDPEGPGEVYWFHLDLYSSDPEKEVKRLLALGATMIQPARKGFDYVTLADPDGNPFDVVEARGFKFGQRLKSHPP